MRILLIEDDQVLGSAVRDQIASDGHSVDWAKRLDDAAAAMNAAAYELVLLDLMLPDMEGYEVVRRLSRWRRAGAGQGAGGAWAWGGGMSREGRNLTKDLGD